MIIKKPQIPPSFDSLVDKYRDIDEMGRIFSAARSGLQDRDYYHWNKLRHLPPPVDLTPEQW